MLYPKDSLTRDAKGLSGIWNFQVDFNDEGLEQEWYKSSLPDPIFMPVPSSYNDITADPKIRDHIGCVWYEKTFFSPDNWATKDILIRFGAVAHKCIVWLNGHEIVRNKGGFLPFEALINDYIKAEELNRITVRVDNILDSGTLPPGEVKIVDGKNHENGNRVFGAQLDSSVLPVGYKTQDYYHDFFNYSGIHRPVIIYSRNRTYLDDITVKTDIDGNEGVIEYIAEIEGTYKKIEVRLFDEDGRELYCSGKVSGQFRVKQPRLWEPLNAYLYSVDVKIYDSKDELLDHYVQPTGIRTVQVKGNQFLINGKPFYFRGFGKHEDMDIKGKGSDDALNVRDFNLLQWIGANSFRTSHYPYSEETLDLADRLGIVIIDESPAVGLRFLHGDREFFSKDRALKPMLEHHLETMTRLVKRDKNHPCVVMWSIANEPASFEEGSVAYFEKVVRHTRKLDPDKPLTIVSCCKPEDCKISHLIDVLAVNYYFSWYTTPGRLDVIEHQLELTLKKWHNIYNKPLIMAEYGADTIVGFHSAPSAMFTEDYQCEWLDLHHKVFDKLDFVVGEHVWNFADFATKQEFCRVMGNRKGVFTRQRQPKAAAHLLRKRWRGIE